MVALRAWYDPDDDQEPIIIGSTGEVDALLDRMAIERVSMRTPPLMQLSRRDADGWAVLHVGVNADRGFLAHTDARGSFVTASGRTASGELLTYDYMGHVREVPADAEVPLTDVREAVHEFVTTNGARPLCVEWQPDV